MAKARSTETAERILAQALDLFNRFGEPNVSPAQLAGMLGMSAGNLYYHFPSKAELIVTLFNGFERRLKKILPASVEITNTEDAWFFIHTLFELIGEYRFVYRDLSDLLSKNVRIEHQVRQMMNQKIDALETLIHGLYRHGMVALDKQVNTRVIATHMAVLMTYWLNFDYIKSPRLALDPKHTEQALATGAFHTLHVLAPYLQGRAAAHLQSLTKAYL